MARTIKGPMYDPQSERAVLGALDKLGNDIPPEYARWLELLTSQDFDVPKHQAIHEALTALREAGTPIDTVTVESWLSQHRKLDQWRTWEQEIMADCESALRFPTYARTVLERSMEREQWRIGSDAAQLLISVEEAGRRFTALQARRERLAAAVAGVADTGDEDEDDGPSPSGETAPFPIAAFPVRLQRLLNEAAKAFPCPPEFVGVPLLALAGAAIGNSRHLEIKRTWREPPIIWAAIVGPSSAKKTPPLTMLRHIWITRQRKLAKQYEDDMRQWEEEARAAKAEDKVPGPPPILKDAFVSDFTTEALTDVLVTSPRGVALISDELDAWVRSMNQYKGGKGSDRQYWLSLWSGVSYRVHRRNRKLPADVNDPLVGIVGGIQPDILTDLNDERGRQDGFIYRILFAYPDALPVSGFTEDEVAEDTLRDLEAIFHDLWKLNPIEAEDGTTRPVLLHFTPEARKLWKAWTEEHAAEQNAPDFPAMLSGPWQKFVSYAARFALIMHELRRAAGEPVGRDVDKESMRAARDLMAYFKAHARRVYALLHTSEEDKQLLSAVEWIRRQMGQKTTARAILRAHVGGVKTSDEAKRLLNRLADEGYGKVDDKPSRRGKASTVFTLGVNERTRTRDNHATGDNMPPTQAGRAA